jgi:hypothetical protein
MSDETRQLWNLLKGKITEDAGLADVKLYYPELAEEVDAILAARKKINCSE